MMSDRLSSSVSSFSTVPPASEVTFYSKQAGLVAPRRSSTIGIESSTSLPTLPSARDRFGRSEDTVVASITSGLSDTDLQSALSSEQLSDDPKADVKRKKAHFFRAFKNAKLHAKKSFGTWRTRRSRMAISPDVEDTFGPKIIITEPGDDVNVEAEAPTNASASSLVAEQGSPATTLLDFPASPPLIARDSMFVAKLRETRAHQPQIAQRQFSLLQLAVVRYFARIALFFPYTMLVGFMPFLLPKHLSGAVFSPTLGYATRPLAPMEVFAYYSKTLPWHVGTSLGLLFVGLWALSKSFPGFAVSLLAALMGRTMWAWGDFQTGLRFEDSNVGIDDRTTIFWLLQGFVLGDLTYSMDDFSKWYKEEEHIDCGEEDGEMEAWEREVAPGRSVNFVIRLKDKPQECLRIVVDCEESFD